MIIEDTDPIAVFVFCTCLFTSTLAVFQSFTYDIADYIFQYERLWQSGLMSPSLPRRNLGIIRETPTVSPAAPRHRRRMGGRYRLAGMLFVWFLFSIMSSFPR
jgi:hypothetical protein